MRPGSYWIKRVQPESMQLTHIAQHSALWTQADADGEDWDCFLSLHRGASGWQALARKRLRHQTPPELPGLLDPKRLARRRHTHTRCSCEIFIELLMQSISIISSFERRLVVTKFYAPRSQACMEHRRFVRGASRIGIPVGFDLGGQALFAQFDI